MNSFRGDLDVVFVCFDPDSDFPIWVPSVSVSASLAFLFFFLEIHHRSILPPAPDFCQVSVFSKFLYCYLSYLIFYLILAGFVIRGSDFIVLLE